MFRNGARYNSIGPWLSRYFGERTVKAAIDAGFTCPNRDGTRGWGGCTFCSGEGSGEYAGIVHTGLSEDGRMIIPVKEHADGSGEIAPPVQQISSQLEFISEKWSDPLCLAYFQNFTNTYAPVEQLRRLYYNALSHPKCVGLAIATRPDCIGPDVLELLREINAQTFLWIELGLQTSHPQTAERINRCCTLEEYDRCVSQLLESGIRVVTHLMFGLPGESREDMMNSVRYVCREEIFGIKIHLLNILKGTPMDRLYLNGEVPLPEREEYIQWAVDALELIPEDITIHRLTGDAPQGMLRAPLWAADKRYILNGINKELKKRGSIQGCRAAGIRNPR
ncbi:MAG: TIGR01212 family radical SAM protein [Firmicutes bacterium]|nr:TIGR01212 family radical SAM protein [Bacillota bacterium]